MTPEEIRARADSMTPRTHPDGAINARHVAIEQTLRQRHGHPSHIAELDGPGRFRPVTGPPRSAVEQAARVAADLADDEPRTRMALGWSHCTGLTYEAARDNLDRLADALRATAEAAFRAAADLGDALRRAGLSSEEPPDDPRARALWARQHRNTGPDRDLTHQRRPRRLP